MKEGVSIVICCYNSAKVITKTLEHISRQKVNKDISWEVVLINNGSTDNTVMIARNIWENSICDKQLRVIDCPEHGILAARKKGVEMARFEYILFCDDDNWLNPDYIERAYRIMESNSQISILGGKGEAVFEKKKPKWFNRYKLFFACGPQGLGTGEITKDQKFVYGAGSVYRKSIFARLSPFLYLPGGSQKGARCGEDSLFGLIHIISGYKLYYDERLTFKHYIDKERASFKYLLKLRWYHGVEEIYFRPYWNYINNRKIKTASSKFKYIQKKMMHILSAIKNCFVKHISKRVLMEKTLSITRNLSSIINMLKFKKSYRTYTHEVEELIYKINEENGSTGRG